MKMQVPQEVLEKVIRRSELEHSHEAHVSAPARAARVIVISRGCGSGGTPIANLVGERMGWTVWDSQILNILADSSQGHYQTRMFKMLDEKTQGAIELNLLACLGELDEHTYLYLLSKAIAIIGHRDGVIVGRGADILLPKAFRVRISAPIEACVHRMMPPWNLSEGETLRRIKHVDRERGAFRKELARCLGRKGPRGGMPFDLEINTARVSCKAAAEAICAAARLFFPMDT